VSAGKAASAGSAAAGRRGSWREGDGGYLVLFDGWVKIHNIENRKKKRKYEKSL
jgi:hypothetical protein